jgi:nickel/cobalt exporter
MRVKFRRALTSSTVLKIALIAVLAVVMLDVALAQNNPFNAPRPAAAEPHDGIVGWILTMQSEFYRQLTGLVRAAKADGNAAWTLFGVSFLYGVFHAAGPGHGKAVISSYLVANNETWKRGVMLACVSALLQALVAVVLVAIAAGLIGVTSRSMNGAIRWIEIGSYALIALMGLRLTYTKGREFIAALREAKTSHADAEHHHHGPHHLHLHEDHRHAAGSDHRHAHSAASTGEALHHHAARDHAHEHHDHAHCSHAGHSHGPAPAELAGPGGWQRGLSAVVAVGARPCSGAILVLVFALAQGMFWAGVIATFVMGAGTALTTAGIATLAVTAKNIAARFAAHREGGGALLLRGVEVGAAVVVLVFGVALLAGYIVTERMF